MLTGTAKIINVFYRHGQEANQFLQSNGSVSRRNFFRILVLACVDILLTLPIGIINTVIQVFFAIQNHPGGLNYQLYYGWGLVHSDWEPVSAKYSDLVDGGLWATFQFYFQHWASPILAITIFALFGLTSEAHATYWRGICAVGRIFGWKPSARKQDDIGEIRFGARQITMTEQCVFTFRVGYRISSRICVDHARVSSFLQ
jgi:hypothetical protein